MTPDQIRAAINEYDSGSWESARWLQELAAQVADSNELRRQALVLSEESHRLHVEEYGKRNRQLDQLTSAQTVLSDSIAKGPTPVRILPPDDGETPQHLGCIVRMPDDSHALATNTGVFVPLDADQANRLIAMLSNPEPGAPQ